MYVKKSYIWTLGLSYIYVKEVAVPLHYSNVFDA